MGLYKYLRENYPKNFDIKSKLIQFRKEPSIIRIERPTRLDKARRLGWKPIPGIIIVRVRVKKGWRKRKDMPRSRRSKAYYWYRSLNISLRAIAEQRAQRKYTNMEVLNSYYVAEDGKYVWYEVILADPYNPNVYSREQYSWLINRKNRKRALRGLSSGSKK